MVRHLQQHNFQRLIHVNFINKHKIRLPYRKYQKILNLIKFGPIKIFLKHWYQKLNLIEVFYILFIKVMIIFRNYCCQQIQSWRNRKFIIFFSILTIIIRSQCSLRNLRKYWRILMLIHNFNPQKSEIIKKPKLKSKPNSSPNNKSSNQPSKNSPTK